MKRWIVTSFLLAGLVPAVGHADHDTDWDDWYDGDVEVRLQVTRGEGAVYAPGEPVWAEFETNADAYVLVLGIDTDGGQRILEVWNKIDRLSPEARENVENIAARRPPERPCFLVSAETGEGIDGLLVAIEERLAATRTTLHLSIDAADGAGISWLHRNSEVLGKDLLDGRFEMTVRVDETKRQLVINRFDAVPQEL